MARGGPGQRRSHRTVAKEGEEQGHTEWGQLGRGPRGHEGRAWRRNSKFQGRKGGSSGETVAATVSHCRDPAVCRPGTRGGAAAAPGARVLRSPERLPALPGRLRLHPDSAHRVSAVDVESLVGSWVGRAGVAGLSPTPRAPPGGCAH